jgi:hypothetical protein
VTGLRAARRCDTSPAIGDASRRGNVPKPHGVLSEADQGSAVADEEGPLGHEVGASHLLETNCNSYRKGMS